MADLTRWELGSSVRGCRIRLPPASAQASTTILGEPDGGPDTRYFKFNRPLVFVGDVPTGAILFMRGPPVGRPQGEGPGDVAIESPTHRQAPHGGDQTLRGTSRGTVCSAPSG